MDPPAQRITLNLLPAALRRYVVAVSGVGLVLPLGLVLLAPPVIDRADAAWLAALLPILIVAERFPVHLTHKTNLSVATALYVALLLLEPWSLLGVIALVAMGVAQLWQRPPAVEAVFNVGQTAGYVSVVALVYHAVEPRMPGPEIGSFGSLGAIVVASVVMHLVNSALVAGAGAFQLGLNPLRVWLLNLTIDLTPHLSLTTLGIIGAMVVGDQPLFLPLLVLPGLFVHQAVKQTTRLRVDTHEALASLVEVIELQDPYTAGHSHRVAALARILAHRLGMTEQEADVIEQAGRVHDIGKIGVETAILTRSGRLTPDEWEQMRQHPVHGANVIERFATYRQIARIVRHHHESWDGSGYPDGLAGEAIPVGARVLAVVDTFDALTTNRPYSPAMSWMDAIDILEAGAGRFWDPGIVAAFVAHVRQTSGEVPAHRPLTSVEPVQLDAAVAYA